MFERYSWVDPKHEPHRSHLGEAGAGTRWRPCAPVRRAPTIRRSAVAACRLSDPGRRGGLTMQDDRQAMTEAAPRSERVTREEAVDLHSRWRPGKIEIPPTKPLATQGDLSLAYSP